MWKETEKNNVIEKHAQNLFFKGETKGLMFRSELPNVYGKRSRRNDPHLLLIINPQ